MFISSEMREAHVTMPTFTKVLILYLKCFLLPRLLYSFFPLQPGSLKERMGLSLLSSKPPGIHLLLSHPCNKEQERHTLHTRNHAG